MKIDLEVSADMSFKNSVHWKKFVDFKEQNQTSMHGCQLPDFSLRSQAFPLLFYICLKPSHHKTTSKHPRIHEFWLYFAKKILWPQTKTGKRPHTAGCSCAWVGLWPVVTCILSTWQNFQTFFKHNVGNPVNMLVLIKTFLMSDWSENILLLIDTTYVDVDNSIK